jgi:hypothetical protein
MGVRRVDVAVLVTRVLVTSGRARQQGGRTSAHLGTTPRTIWHAMRTNRST